MNLLPQPYDPMCDRLAENIEYLDTFWASSKEELEATDPLEYPVKRAEYIRREEGTYNKENGHFLCDECYIRAGMPTSPNGWKCP